MTVQTLFETLVLLAVNSIVGVLIGLFYELWFGLLGSGIDVFGLEPGLIQSILISALALIVTGLIFYAQQEFKRPFRYLAGLKWGVVWFLLVHAIDYAMQVPSILQQPTRALPLIRLQLFFFDAVRALPLVFIFLPVMVWMWQKTVKGLRENERVA